MFATPYDYVSAKKSKHIHEMPHYHVPVMMPLDFGQLSSSGGFLTLLRRTYLTLRKRMVTQKHQNLSVKNCRRTSRTSLGAAEFHFFIVCSCDIPWYRCRCDCAAAMLLLTTAVTIDVMGGV
eukprot:scaffold224100_cov38-Attheya_sp.AAC.1